MMNTNDKTTCGGRILDGSLFYSYLHNACKPGPTEKLPTSHVTLKEMSS